MGEPFFPKGSEKAAEAHYAKKGIYEQVFGPVFGWGPLRKPLSQEKLESLWSKYRKLLVKAGLEKAEDEKLP